MKAPFSFAADSVVTDQQASLHVAEPEEVLDDGATPERVAPVTPCQYVLPWPNISLALSSLHENRVS